MKRPKHKRIQLGLFGFVSVVCLASQAIASDTPKKVDISEAQLACTDKEAWTLGTRIRPELGDKIIQSIRNPDQAAPSLLEATNLKASAKRLESQALMDYWFWRVLYQAKLVHLANQGFNTLIASANAPETMGIKLAAIECQNRIHQAYPTLGLSPQAFKSVLAAVQGGMIQKEKMTPVYDSISGYVQRGVLTASSSAELAPALSALSGGGAYEGFAKMLVSSKFETENEILQNASSLDSLDGLGANAKTRADYVHLTLGQSYYGLKKYDSAMKEFRKIDTTSNYYAHSLSDLSWAYLMGQKYQEAVGSSSNLLLGPLKKTFAPEAYVVASIAFNETCHFPEAIESIRLFRRAYGKSFRWLNDWKNKKVADSDNLYSYVAKFLKKTAKVVPDKIGTEWIRSPVFLANQEELNLVYDEKVIAKTVWTNVSKIGKGKDAKKYTKARRDIYPIFTGLIASLPSRENGLVRQINGDLAQRTSEMYSNLVDASDNIQRVEVEAYNSMGDKMIVDNIREEANKPAPLRRTLKKSEEGPVWDWGRFPADDDDNAEYWEDELGFLKADLKDGCVKH